MSAASTLKINLPSPALQDFCQRWQITEFALFGSVLRDDFRPDSDLDCLVQFSPAAEWSLLDRVKMQQELTAMTGRKIDLVNKQAIERSPNWLRQREILRTARTIYSAPPA